MDVQHIGQAPAHAGRFHLIDDLRIFRSPNDAWRHHHKQFCTPFRLGVVAEKSTQDRDVR
jgi:hypothetical protein